MVERERESGGRAKKKKKKESKTADDVEARAGMKGNMLGSV